MLMLTFLYTTVMGVLVLAVLGESVSGVVIIIFGAPITLVYLSLLSGSGRVSQPVRGGGAAKGTSKEVEHLKSRPRNSGVAQFLLPSPLYDLWELSRNGRKLVVIFVIFLLGSYFYESFWS